jgi:hypothetical protein
MLSFSATASLYALFIYNKKHKVGLGLWCLMQLSTIFDGHMRKIKDLKIEKTRLGHELDLKVSITDKKSFFFNVKNQFLVA